MGAAHHIASELRYDSRSRFLRRETVLAPYRNLPLDQGRQRARMQHLRARVGQLGRLTIGDLIQYSSVGNQPRIAGHDAVHVGPDPQLFRVHRCRDYGCREIRAAAAQSGWPAIQRRGVESRDHRDNALLQQRPQNQLRSLASLVHQWRRVAEHVVGGYHLRRVHCYGAGSLRFQISRHEQGRQPLSDCDGAVYCGQRTLAQQQDAFGDAGEFAD